VKHILGTTELDDWEMFIRKVIRTELKTTHMEIKLQTRKKEINTEKQKKITIFETIFGFKSW